MMKDTLYVGLDTDKKWIDISVAEPLPGGEVRYFGKIANQAASLDRVLKHEESLYSTKTYPHPENL